MFNICIHCIVFELCLAGKKERRKKEDEQNGNFMFGFLTLLKVNGTYRVDLALE